MLSMERLNKKKHQIKQQEHKKNNLINVNKDD